MSYPVVSEKMHYGLKPIAVELKTHLLTVPCVCMQVTHLALSF